MGFERLNIEGIAIDLIEHGKAFEGYVLILLQQIRNELREVNK